ncbi:MAG: sortase [Chloroflexota bacterium]
MFEQNLRARSGFQQGAICLLITLTIGWLVFGIVWAFPHDQAVRWVDNLTIDAPEEAVIASSLPTIQLETAVPLAPQILASPTVTSSTLSPEILKSSQPQSEPSESRDLLVKAQQTGLNLNKVDNLDVTSAPLPKPLENAQIIIPSLGLTHTITQVPIVSGNWDISDLGSQVGHLQSTGESPNQGHAMTFIGHATVPWPGVGPFADLIQVEHGEQIIYRWGGTDYVYEVSRILLVDPSAVDTLYEPDGEMIILATCSNWDFVEREYDKRLVTQAKLVRTEPSPSEDRRLGIGDQ